MEKDQKEDLNFGKIFIFGTSQSKYSSQNTVQTGESNNKNTLMVAIGVCVCVCPGSLLICDSVLQLLCSFYCTCQCCLLVIFYSPFNFIRRVSGYLNKKVSNKAVVTCSIQASSPVTFFIPLVFSC